MADTEIKKGDTATGLKGLAFDASGPLTSILEAAEKLEVRIKSAGKFINGEAEAIDEKDPDDPTTTIWNWKWLPEEASQVEHLDDDYKIELWVYISTGPPVRIMKLPNKLTENPTMAITQDLVE